MGMHTPGPWEVGGPYPGVSVIFCVDPALSQSHWEAVCIVDSRISGEQSLQALADAHLIAAAPELLEALRDLLKLHHSKHSLHLSECPALACVAAHAAIKKAEGR